ncbi:hypothetical protein NL676_005376 [Syzygium grande]|nr:hypothetical protein NL676_005376 [Syzygium grande]
MLRTKLNHPRPYGCRASLRASLSASLNPTEIPRQWYNLVAVLHVKPPPPLHPRTFQPVTPDDLSPLLPDELIKQEASLDRFIDIPDEVLDIYQLWCPMPLMRAKRLEKLLDTPARICYKYEGEPCWVTQTEHGSASSLVWQVRSSYDQKPYRRLMMRTWGAKVHPSPSEITEAGRKILQEDPLSSGSLGIAISEAVEVAANNAEIKYWLGSVLNHVLLHQTVIGEECIKQLEAIGETPDMIIGCTGVGSNFAGLSFPFIRETLKGNIKPIIRAIELAACPLLTKGVYAYDCGNTAGMTPLMKMHTLGHDFIPVPIHAGGLRYHGMAPLISHVYELGLMEAISIPQVECFQAPEPTHAIAATIREALLCRESGESKVILTEMCGHGHFDLAAYEKYLPGDMVDLSFSEEKIHASLAKMPPVAAQG